MRVVVVGGGVSGLTAAYRLRRYLGDRAEIIVLESTAEWGGKLHTATVAGRPFDVGAEAFLARRPEGLALADELGLGDELAHPTGASASVRAGGTTTPLPKRTVMGVPSSGDTVAGVLSADAVRTVAAEAELAPLALPESDVSLGGLLSERFGDELVDRLVDPLLGGVYAGGADGLGLRATVPGLAAALDAGAGSLTAAAAGQLPATPSTAPVFATLTGGLGTLVQRLATASAAELRLGTTVTGIRRDGDSWLLHLGGGTTATSEDSASSETSASSLHADRVVLAVPAPAAAKLLAHVAPEAARAFGEIELASMAVLALALPESTRLPDASGVLIGHGEQHADGTPFTAKAFTFSSRKWGHQHRDGEPLLVRGSVGRFGEPENLRATDDELVRRVRADLAELTGVTAEPVDTHVRRWGGGLPQYGVGHTERVARIERAVAAVAGLEVTGAALHGVGIPACIATAESAARRLVGR